MYIIKAAIDANEKQKRKMVEKMNDAEGKHIAVLGLSFKPDTDEI